MKNKKTKDIMILSGSIIASMIAGFTIGCLKEKMMMNKCNCFVDEL